ncbi:MAG: hypothetical protein ACJ71D_12210 [Nitrososphaera sp.]
MTSKLRNVAVSSQNYDRLKSLGRAGDSFNDVISHLLKKSITLEPEEKGKE